MTAGARPARRGREGRSAARIFDVFGRFSTLLDDLPEDPSHSAVRRRPAPFAPLIEFRHRNASLWGTRYAVKAVQRLILVVDDREISREMLVTELEEAGHRVVAAKDGNEGWAAFRERRFDLVITDLRMPGTDGMALLRRIRSRESQHPQAPVILLSAYGTLSIATDAGKAGATDFFPYNDKGVEALLQRVDEVLRSEPPDLPDALVGESSAIAETRERILALSDLRAPVLIRGEPGTGRGAVAGYIHHSSPFAHHPFAAVACASDAARRAPPECGSVHLERVEQLSERAQAQWLAQLRRLDAAGDGATLRVIASSADDLVSLAEEGDFDRDLAAMLTRFTVLLPPLRQRPEDLDGLLAILLRRVGDRVGRRISRVTEAAVERLKAQPWHGNVAQLECVLESLVAFASDGEIRSDRVERFLLDLESPLSRISEQRARDERKQLLALYAKHGTFSGVARELGITRNAAKYRFAKYDLLPARRSWRGSPRSA